MAVSRTVRSLAPKSPRIFAADDTAGDLDDDPAEGRTRPSTANGSRRASSTDLTSLGALDPSTAAAQETAGKPRSEREKWLLADRELRKFRSKVRLGREHWT